MVAASLNAGMMTSVRDWFFKVKMRFVQAMIVKRENTSVSPRGWEIQHSIFYNATRVASNGVQL